MTTTRIALTLAAAATAAAWASNPLWLAVAAVCVGVAAWHDDDPPPPAIDPTTTAAFDDAYRRGGLSPAAARPPTSLALWPAECIIRPAAVRGRYVCSRGNDPDHFPNMPPDPWWTCARFDDGQTA